ncbi:MAG: hypothetical protein GEV09_16820 [Pseudonocardiaceae bacterium]|nr:hypothetical protein [Pseudonocardiaceae bacterium]
MSNRRSFLSLLATLPVSILAAPAATAGPDRGPRPVEVSQRTVPLSARSDEPVRTVRSGAPFSMVGLRFSGRPPADVMQLRVPGGAWLTVEQAGDAQASQPAWTGPTREVQVRALRGGAPATDVAVVLIDPGRSPADARLRTARDGGYPVITREGWGADESLRCMQPQYSDGVRAVALHHTAGANDYGPEDSPAIVRGIYAYHAQTLGWCDIGYHALVDRYGQVFEGRAGGLDRAVIGAHSGGFNLHTSSAAMMGSYTGQEAGEAQRRALADYLDWKLGVHGLDPTATTTLTCRGGGTSRYPEGAQVSVPVLFGHRDVGHTECPGDDGYALLPGLRSAAAATASPAK